MSQKTLLFDIIKNVLEDKDVQYLLGEPQSIRSGWKITERIGICVINDHAIRKITINE